MVNPCHDIALIRKKGETTETYNNVGGLQVCDAKGKKPDSEGYRLARPKKEDAGAIQREGSSVYQCERPSDSPGQGLVLQSHFPVLFPKTVSHPSPELRPECILNSTIPLGSKLHISVPFCPPAASAAKWHHKDLSSELTSEKPILLCQDQTTLTVYHRMVISKGKD